MRLILTNSYNTVLIIKIVPLTLYPLCLLYNSKSSGGSSGHDGGTKPGQTRKKPKDLSSREREEWVWGGGGVVS